MKLIGRIDDKSNVTNHWQVDDERTACGLKLKIMQTQRALDDDQLTCGRCRRILNQRMQGTRS